MVELQHVALRYGAGPEILRGLNVRLAAGEMCFLTGPSGSGKSTLLRLLFLALAPSAGEARIFGADAASLSPRARAHLRRRIGIVFQDFRLLPHLSVFDNVALPLRASGQNIADHAANIADLLAWVGLGERAHDLPETLSGGEQQRAAIARAVVARPDLILADEPTGNVDAEMAKRLLGLFRELNRQGATVLIATHDQRMIAGRRLLRLANGGLVPG